MERRRLLSNVDRDKTAGRADLNRFALGSGTASAICAVRRMDLDLAGIPVVAGSMLPLPLDVGCWNSYPVRAKGLGVYDGKSAMALRVVPVRTFVVDRLCLRQHADDGPGRSLSPPPADGTPWPANVRRSVHAVRDHHCLGWLTPHPRHRACRSCQARAGRRATILDDALSLTGRPRADLMRQAEVVRTPPRTAASCSCTRPSFSLPR